MSMLSHLRCVVMQNLRGSEEKKQIGSGVRTHDSMIGTADENRNSTTACSKKGCQKNTQQLAELLTKVYRVQQTKA